MIREWAMDRKHRQDKSARAPKPRSNLVSYVESQRKRIRTQNTPRARAALETQLADLRKHLATLTARFQVREHEECAARIKTIEGRISSIDTGKELAEFNDTVQPYLDMVQQMEETKSVATQKKRALVSVPNNNIKKPRTEFEGELSVYDESTIRDELAAKLEDAPPPVCMIQEDMCSACNVPMVVMASEARVGCPSCSRTRPYIQSTSCHIPYGEEVEFASFSYKRQNHFQEWLNAIQAKENTEVPVDVINQVMEHLFTKIKVRDTNSITQANVRQALKELNMRKQYDHTMQIYVSITGKPPPRFSAFHEEQLRLMFDAIQGPFNKHRPPDRKNFLSYAYCLNKFCQILGLDEFLPYFQLLKGAEKLKRQDTIFKNICEELNWQFIPSPSVVENDVGGGTTLEHFYNNK